MTANLKVEVAEGNKIVEVKNAGINKGRAAMNWIGRKQWDFILAVGDDLTDEDLFRELPERSYPPPPEGPLCGHRAIEMSPMRQRDSVV